MILICIILMIITTGGIVYLNMEWKMLMISIITLIINAVMLIVAIRGIVLPLQEKKKEERRKSKKSISIINSIIKDKKERLNIIYMTLNVFEIKPFKENKEKTFINDNYEAMAFTISHLENNNFIEKIQGIRDEYSRFLFSKFEMIEDSDIENIKNRIKDIDELIFQTDQIYNLVPKEIRKNQSIIDVEEYLNEGINEHFNGEESNKEEFWIASALHTFENFEGYKELIKNIDQKL